ncbi:MAG: catalase [Oscillospiraceae bacterium]|nr:catalase [Oscillospiraceae bacterium]
MHCAKAGIIWRGIWHDMSKFSPSEFIPSIVYFQGNRSPNEAEREKNGFSKAWIHHKGRNRHHFEYWTDYNTKTKKLECVKMPDIFIVEMFCDRVAASKTYLKDKYTDKSPLDYFLKGQGRKIMYPDTARKIGFLLNMLAEKGEDYTFRYIRKNITKKL